MAWSPFQVGAKFGSMITLGTAHHPSRFYQILSTTSRVSTTPLLDQSTVWKSGTAHGKADLEDHDIIRRIIHTCRYITRTYFLLYPWKTHGFSDDSSWVDSEFCQVSIRLHNTLLRIFEGTCPLPLEMFSCGRLSPLLKLTVSTRGCRTLPRTHVGVALGIGGR